jgi:hypothetical protein
VSPSARPTGAVLARGRHPVAEAVDPPGTRRSSLGRCAERAADGLMTIRALVALLSPEEETRGLGDELASL